MSRKILHSQYGLTLIEMMIAMAISGILITGFYEMFYSQQRSYLAQDQVVEMQQNLRAAMNLMTREIRAAGFDPWQAGNFGIVTNFSAPHNIFSPPIDYVTKKNVIAFTLDDDQDGGTPEANNNELIAYRLDNKDLQRYNSVETDPSKRWQTIATNIEALDFVFLDGAGDPTTDPTKMRAVEISVLVRTGKVDKHFTGAAQVFKNKQGQNICPSPCGANKKYRRRLISTTVDIRNL